MLMQYQDRPSDAWAADGQNDSQKPTANHELAPHLDRHPWRDHIATYRAKEIATIARWIAANASGSLIGMNGVGKSDMIGFLCHRQQALQQHLPHEAQSVALLLVDLNNLPERTLSALYRVMLRTFYEQCDWFDAETQACIRQLYLENRAATDPFLAQSALRQLLIHLQKRGQRVVFVLDRFDAFCRMLTVEMSDSLRGLRDGFKNTLAYIASMRQGLAYLPDPEILGELYRLLDANVCYVGPMNEADTRDTIRRRLRFAAVVPDESELAALWQWTGGYPSLVMALCQRRMLMEEPPNLAHWFGQLLKESSVRSRLHDIWQGLTQEEQQVLSRVQIYTSSENPTETKNLLATFDSAALAAWGNLLEKGLCQPFEQEGRIFSQLFAAYIGQIGGQSRGRIWLDETSSMLYQGQKCLSDLTPKEQNILHFFVQQPRLRHTYTDVILAAWLEEERRNGVSNDSLYQVVRGLRLKIEPNPAEPVYLLNWRGKPEGGYQFFPEGRPR